MEPNRIVCLATLAANPPPPPFRPASHSPSPHTHLPLSLPQLVAAPPSAHLMLVWPGFPGSCLGQGHISIASIITGTTQGKGLDSSFSTSPELPKPSMPTGKVAFLPRFAEIIDKR